MIANAFEKLAIAQLTDKFYLEQEDATFDGIVSGGECFSSDFQQYIWLKYSRRSFPLFKWMKSENAKLLDLSLRSRLGQYGLEMDRRWTLDRIVENFEHHRQKILDTGETVAVARVNNWGRQELNLRKGAGFLRFFNVGGAERLEEQRLVDAVNSEEIQVHGEHEKDWKFAKEGEQIIGLYLMINEDSWRHFAQKKRDTPIEIDEGQCYRGVIDQEMEKLETSDFVPGEKVFTVSQTRSRLDIVNPKINALVPKLMEVHSLRVGMLRYFTEHSAARVIEGGNGCTKWPIRLENYSSIVGIDERPDRALFVFYRDRK